MPTFTMASPRSDSGSSNADPSDVVQAAVQQVYKLPKSWKRRYSVMTVGVPGSSFTTEDFVISPKSVNLHQLKALDYFTQAELANVRLADFKAASERKAKTKARSKSSEPTMTAREKLRKATEKVVAVNMLRHPMMANGLAKADLGKVNDLKARLSLRRQSVSQ